MKISSRSLLSPGRAGPGSGSAHDQQPMALSTSLSRRLRNSRSIKGGASPAMFPATGKKRGGFDNPEPSSPKVTCIGQVRVKSKKKHAKNMRSLSRRRSSGEVSFRKLEHSRSQSQHLGSNYQLQTQECLQGQRNNQSWVHLPLTICEALRTFGSEFSCLFPCRSSCSSTAMEKEEKVGVERGSRQGSCAVFARWLVAVQEGDGGGRDSRGGGGREIELVTGDGEDEHEEMDFRNSRRHVFQDLEIVNDIILGTKDEARVSICVPPKNALLLMRCRSDPVKMEALTNRPWEPTVEKNEEEDENFIDDEDDIEDNKIPQEDIQLEKEEKVMAFVEGNDQEHNDLQNETTVQEKTETNFETETKEIIQKDGEMDLEMDTKQSVAEEEMETNPEMEVKEESESSDMVDANEEEEEEESMFLWSLFADEKEESENSDMVDVQQELFDDVQAELFEDVQETQAVESNTEGVIKDFEEENKEDTTTAFITERSEKPNETHEGVVMESKQVEFRGADRENEEKDISSKRLPECLLLMMCEPKLSMEVSKETWVCSSDFIRHRSSKKKPPPAPTAPVKSIENKDESKPNHSSPNCAKDHDNQVMTTSVIEYHHLPQQPARSSCSYPAPPSMATTLEQKLRNPVKMGLGFEPLVLKRCKSEPKQTASAKPAPGTCF